jgi:hypothetical protein
MRTIKSLVMTYLNGRLIALDLKDYVAKADGLGRSSELRKDTERRIRTAVPMRIVSKHNRKFIIIGGCLAENRSCSASLVDGTTCSS